MDNMKNDEYFADRIINDLSFIAAHTEGITDAELKSDEVLLDSMMFRLIQISENAKKLSGQYRADHSNIPWSDIYGLRNRIVHDYGSIDIGVIYGFFTEYLGQKGPVRYEVAYRQKRSHSANCSM
ncbi:MAG: DUF86 domain-containing protein [Clostridiales bacterium]|nr:DUF86 domain-containing protein [Clostridiales bacterium]